MDGYGITNATTRPPARARGSAARLAGLALALLLTATAAAVPAEAATAATPTARSTWAQLMRRKIDLDAESARLPGLLPGLRAAVTARNADVARATQARTAAATTLAGATTAEQTARTRYAVAKTAAAAAKKALSAAQKRRPRSTGRIDRAKRALAAARATVQTRAATVRLVASAAKAAQAAYATATGQVDTATTAYRAATKAVSDTEQRIASLPKLRSALAAQAAGMSQQVVTEIRPRFTTAHTTRVYGVTVNWIIAYPFQRMLEDAAKAGVPLSGGGFRTKQRQIELRKINGCPNIWTAPASSCRVPTAIPGRSLHEIGLAVDITSGGKTIRSRKSPAFKWLAANAWRYGFVNLPSEPWHWSITGH